jgi:DNA (cytosine-5)-methyltransferase 1
MGYHRAGFEVVGVDINPQPRYPFAFVQADVLTMDPRFLRWFDAIHASPPCQGYTAMRHAPGAKGAPLLIDKTRGMLEASGRPWIIENVEEARWAMRSPILLCGSMFGLGADGHQLRRHRLFESNVDLCPPGPCDHAEPVIGVYGGHVRCRSAAHGGRGTRDFVGKDKPKLAMEAMGIDWATMNQMSEAVPPAFTEHLGQQMLAICLERIAA